MIPHMREPRDPFNGNQIPGLQSTADFILDRLSAGDPRLDSDDGKRDLDALIQKEPDRVFNTVMNGCHQDWRSIAGTCMERGLAPRTVNDLLKRKLSARSVGNHGIEKCRLLIGHMEQQCLSEMLADFVVDNNTNGLELMAVVNRELLRSTTVDLKFYGSGSLLHLAFSKRQSWISTLLLKLVPDLAARPTSEGENVLGWSINWGIFQMIEPLLKAAPALEYMQDKEGRTALHLAFLAADPRAARILLKHAKDPHGLAKTRDKYGWTVWHYLAAFEKDSESKLLEILQNYRDLLPIRGGRGETALHVACGFCNASVTETLLGCAFFLTKEKDKFGRTPLDVLIEEGHATMVGKMARALAKSVDETGRSVLLAALKFSALCCTEKEGKDVARILFDIVTDQSTSGYLEGGQILEEAARERGEGELIDLLLEFDPQLARWQNSRGMTALHIAAESGNFDGVRHMIRSKDGKEMLHMQMKERMQPIDLALQRGHVFVVNALLSAGKHLSDKFKSLAMIFDTPTDRQAWRDLAMMIADNDYRGYLANEMAEEKFTGFTKKLIPLGDLEAGQRLAMLAIWSNEAGELDDNRQGFQNGIAACRWLSELFSDKWLPDDSKHRWNSIQREALAANEQLHFGPGSHVSRLTSEILGRLLPLPINMDGIGTGHGNKTDGDQQIDDIGDTSVEVRTESPLPMLDPYATPYIPMRDRLPEDTQQRHEYKLDLEQYRLYLQGTAQAIRRQFMVQDFDKKK